MRVDRLFRVFRNSRYPFIDVKQEMEELTELVEVDSDEAFILHPGEFASARRWNGSRSLTTSWPARGQELARAARTPHPLDGRLHRPGLGRPRHARALERRQPPDHDLLRHEDRQLSFVQLSEPAEHPYGTGSLGSKYQGQAGPTPSRYWKNFAT